jgi:hypothetical protein
MGSSTQQGCNYNIDSPESFQWIVLPSNRTTREWEMAQLRDTAWPLAVLHIPIKTRRGVDPGALDSAFLVYTLI